MSDENIPEGKDKAIREIAESLTRRLENAEMAEEREFIDDLITTIESEPNVRVPEPVFREIFLPYITGEKEIKQGDDTVEPIKHWMGLAGGATSKVDVVDVKGNVLFTVPPVLDPACINLSADRASASAFSTIFSSYEDTSRVHWALGRKQLVEDLSEKTAGLFNKPSDDAWKPVLDYYRPKTAGKQQAAPTAQLHGDDDLTLDD